MLREPNAQTTIEGNKKKMMANASIPFQSIQKRKELSEVEFKAKIEREQREAEEELERKKVRSKDIKLVQKLLNKPADVKLTAATILREEALYRKKQEQEAALLNRYEMELRDASENQKYFEQVKEKEDRERIVQIEKVKQDIRDTDLRARKARKEQQKRNEERVHEYKQKTEKEMLVVEKERKIEKELMEKKAKEQSKSLVENVDKAKKNHSQKKAENAGKLREERIQNETLVAERIEIERQRKEELILQIRAMETVPSVDIKLFDPTEVPSHGLLTEMSFLELQERLNYTKRRKEEEREAKNKEIIEQKKERELELLQKARKIAEFRNLAKADRINRRLEKKKLEDSSKLVANTLMNEKALITQEKLEKEREKKRKEMRRLAKESSERLHKQQLLGQDRLMNEKKKFEQVELGAERHAIQRTAKQQKTNTK